MAQSQVEALRNASTYIGDTKVDNQRVIGWNDDHSAVAGENNVPESMDSEKLVHDWQRDDMSIVDMTLEFVRRLWSSASDNNSDR